MASTTTSTTTAAPTTQTYASVEEYIKANYATTTTEQTEATSSASDKDMFLQLLVTQMQYQDPLDPQDNSQFLSQMAQFTSLEQMQNINKATEMNLATGMIGKVVTGTNEDGDAILGVVEGARMINGNAYIRVGKEDVLLSDVTAITSEVDASEIMLDYTKASYASSLVGKVVFATLTDTTTNEDGSTTTNKTEVEGIVQNTKIGEDGSVYVIVDDKEVPINTITKVTEMIPADEEILSYVSGMSTSIDSLIEKLESVIEQLGSLTGTDN